MTGAPRQEGKTSTHSPAVPPGSGSGTVRVDSWIWAVRLLKTRSLAGTACRGGHVRVNGERIKPSYGLRVGDEVRLRHGGIERVVVVTRLLKKRVGAPEAVQSYVDNSPPPPPREAVAPAGVRDRGAGRPTKRDRREMDRLRRAPGHGAGDPAAFPDRTDLHETSSADDAGSVEDQFADSGSDNGSGSGEDGGDR